MSGAFISKKPNTKAMKRKVFCQAGSLSVEGSLNEQWFEVAKCGKYYDWRYGIFKVTPKLLTNLVDNYKSNILGVKVALDCNHDDGHKALAWIADLEIRGKSLFAKFEDWTPDGEKAIGDGEFRYFSIDFGPFERPAGEDKVETIPDVLMGIAATNRPVLKGMEGTFGEKIDPNETDPGTKPGQNVKAMKNMIKKFAQSLAGAERVTAEDKERLNVMLSDLPDEEKEELKPEVDAVDKKADETKAADDTAADEAKKAEEKTEEDKKKDLAEKKTLAETSKDLKDATQRLSVLETEKEERETEEVVNSMMLSEKNKKGFAEGKREEVVAMVKKMGIEASKEFASKMGDITDMTGKTMETGHGDDTAKKVLETSLAEAKTLAESRAKETGKPVHVCLAEVYAEKNLTEVAK